MKNKTFLDSLKCAAQGIVSGFKTEKNFKIYLIHVLISFPLNIFLGISFTQHLIYWTIIAGVFSSECFNTVIEKMCDMITTEYDEKIKFIKDVAAGGVLYWGLAFYILEIIFIVLKSF